MYRRDPNPNPITERKYGSINPNLTLHNLILTVTFEERKGDQ